VIRLAKKTGYTADTPKNLLLDAGAFFVNYTMGTDTFESAKEGGKLLGATRGGGSFSAIPAIRQIEVDGLMGKTKGLEVIDSWEVKMSANIIEVTESVLKKALVSTETDNDQLMYHGIKGKNVIELDDYISNITFVGTYSGSEDPIIIQVYNAINTNGLTLTTSDKGETVIALEFEGHFDASDLDTPPFAIYYPTFLLQP